MSIRQDVRFAVRSMSKGPGFTAAAVLALALGIGANTAIFTVVNAVLLRPLPYKDPERMVFLTRTYPNGRGTSVSIPKFFTWKRNNNVLESVTAYDFMGPGVSISGEGDPEQIKAIHASADFFSLFRVTPAAGRFFTESEDRPGGPRVAVISYGLWTRRFGRDRSLVGRQVVLSGEPYTVVGITAPDFEPNPPSDVWLPLQPDPNSTNQGHYLLCGARLKPGVSLDTANAQMKIIGEQFRRQYPNAMMNKQESAGAVSMRELLGADMRSSLLIMLGAVAFVLLIACANVANLLLARAAAREKEIAIRTAMGANRWRLVRQLLTESTLLALAGGVLGVLLGYWGLKLLLALTPAEIPRLSELATHSGLDLRVLAFTILLSLATGVIFGLAPAFQASRPDLNSTLKEGTTRTTSGVRHLRLRGLLVVSEMALGLILLIGAGLLIRSAAAMRNTKPGFESHRVLTFKTALTGTRFSTTAGMAQFGRNLVQHLESLPAVESAAGAISLPTEPGPDLTFGIEGRPASAANATGDEQWRFITPHYFRAMNVPLLRGRVFTDGDSAKSPPVIIINEVMARKYWPKEDALGQRITVGKGLGKEFEDPTREIVGIVGNVRENGLDSDPPPIMYVPDAQISDRLTALGTKVLPINWVVRTAADPLTLADTVRREVTSVDRQQAIFGVRSMDEVLEKSLATADFILLLLSIFAAIALVLAAIGIYGVISYAVQQRSHEMGIRIALGASYGDVLGMVMRHGMLLAGIGVALGLGAAAGLTRVLKSLLYGVKATDPLTFAMVAVTLLLVALIASWIPARRATRVDPIITLRYE